MDILQDLKERGIFNNITSEEKLFNLKSKTGVYIGFDPTAMSLHLGNYLQISILKRFSQYGFKPYAVVGGATGMIGDPSGKSVERNLLDFETLIENKKKIIKQLEFFGLTVVDNLEFYKNMNVLDFLRNIGKNINVNYMINKETVKTRLESGISFTEFTYQLIQGWDFKCLYDKGVKIQIGGSDQWGNITTGIELIRKTIGENDALGITTNLLLTSNGQKFGKSVGNAIWIDKNLTSSFSLYQYLLKTTDDDIKKMLLWLTFISKEKIDEIISDNKSKPFLKKAQKFFAYELVKDIHSKKDADDALRITNILFESGNVSQLSEEDIFKLVNEIPTFHNIEGNIKDVLVKLGVAQSNREAREFITSKAIEVNGEKIIDDNFIIKPFLFDKKFNILKKGKNLFYLIKY